MNLEKIGEGGEAEVFALDEHRVLRRWRQDHPSIVRRIEFTQEVAAGAGHLDFAVPEILDHHMDDEGRPCFVERRLPGRSMTDALGSVSGAQRSALLTSYLETATALRDIRFERPFVGEIIAEPAFRRDEWSAYLTDVLDRQRAVADDAAYPELDDLDALVDEAESSAASVDPLSAPALVHFDYFPGNVLCDDTRITAVIDWSVLAIMGDPDLDVALSVAYFGVTPTADRDDVAFAWSWLRDRELEEVARRYERWGAAWWLPGSDDETIRSWVVSVLDPR